MNTKDENLLVKLVKKSVGLPTGKSGCCGTATPPAAVSGSNQPSDSASTGCGCASAPPQQPLPPAQGEG